MTILGIIVDSLGTGFEREPRITQIKGKHQIVRRTAHCGSQMGENRFPLYQVPLKTAVNGQCLLSFENTEGDHKSQNQWYRGLGFVLSHFIALP